MSVTEKQALGKNLTHYLIRLLDRGKGWRQIYLSPIRDRCLACDRPISKDPLYQQYRVCPHCRFHYSLTARERVENLVDERSFKENNRSITSLDPLSFSNRAPYKKGLFRDQRRTGLTEAAITGRCRFGGVKTVIVVLDFGFMGGTMGSVVGEKVAQAFEFARKKERPLVAVITGGGARVQEGILSLMQMAKTVTAFNRFQEAGAPFIAVLANPATGQAYASFANLADVILAEPGALMGLVPIRALREHSTSPLPPDAHTAEAHLKHGLIDAVVDREHLRDTLTTLIEVLDRDRDHTISTREARKIKLAPSTQPEPWQAVLLARHEARPTARFYIRSVFDRFTELHGDRAGADDQTVVGGIAFLAGEKVVVIGQDRGLNIGGNGHGHIYPEGFRKAQRLMRLAAKFNLPLITLIDTPGAYPGLEAEEQGIGNAIATTLSLMAELPVPVIAVIIGEGGSEGALAMGVADRVLMQENAIYTAISPERAAATLYRNSAKAQEVAESLRLTAVDCQELGIIDAIVPEPEGASHSSPDAAARYLQLALVRDLGYLLKQPGKKLVKERQQKFRRMGEYSSYFKDAVRQEISLLREIVLRRGRGQPKEPADKKDEKKRAKAKAPEAEGREASG
ncbi:MAG: carboxyl transferase domain-containing protein [Chloroflexota bacterium]|nr:carboxyl transferase domain-containing protein [Chloroflexota bacterium]